MSDAQYPCSPRTDDAHSIPEQQVVTPCQLSLVYILDMMFYGMEYSFGLFSSAVLAMLPPGFLHTSLLAEHQKLKSPWLGL